MISLDKTVLHWEYAVVFSCNLFFDILLVFPDFLGPSFFLYSICKSRFSFYVLFWYFICFARFSDTLFFDISFFFLDILGILLIAVALQGFPDYFAFLYTIFYFPHNIFFILFNRFSFIIISSVHCLFFLFWSFRIISFLKIQISVPLCW